MPQVAFGWRDPPRVVQDEHRLEAREAGRDHLRAAAEAGEEVRLDEPGRDPDVGVHPGPVQRHRHAGRRRADVDERRGVAAVVVDDAVAARDVGAEHLLVFGRRVDAMRAGRDQDRDVFGRMLRQLVKDRLERLLPRLRARDVADRNRDRLPGPDDLAKRRPPERRAQRRDQRRMRIGDGGPEGRLDHRDAVVGKIRPRARRCRSRGAHAWREITIAGGGRRSTQNPRSPQNSWARITVRLKPDTTTTSGSRILSGHSRVSRRSASLSSTNFSALPSKVSDRPTR